MHEISVARQIVSIASGRARALGYANVKAVRVQIGSWTCMNADLLRRAFAAATSENGKSGADLHVEVVKPQCKCGECGCAFEPDEFALRCVECGSARVVLTHGREIVVESIEV